MKIMYEVVDMTHKSLCTNHGQKYFSSPLFQNLEQVTNSNT